jgi:predicted membrane-bound mannosyltransferase
MAESLQAMWLFFGRQFAVEIAGFGVLCDVQLLRFQLRHQDTDRRCFVAVMGKTLAMCVRNTERFLLMVMILFCVLVLQKDGHT